MQANSINEQDRDLLLEMGREAGQIALRYFQKSPETWMKEGDSPVTEADYAVDEFLRNELMSARPDYGWLSEETEDDQARLGRTRTFVVDPIDGTRGFINGMNKWCVSLAIVEDNRPVVGVLECPVLRQSFDAVSGQGCRLNEAPIHIRSEDELGVNRVLKVTGPRALLRSMSDKGLGDYELISYVPSLAYRIAMVVTQELDVAFARGSARDWDLAAADLIVQEAGGMLTDINGSQLRYNCPSTRQGALISSVARHHDDMLKFARQTIEMTSE